MNTTLDEIRDQLAVLTARVAALETAAGSSPAAGAAGTAVAPTAVVSSTPVAAPTATVAEELNDETLLIISAAIAAFFGKRPRIRQIRLVTSETWAQQGRIGIHASHALPVQSRSGALS